ncbi:hypothetical protein [Prosthecobacter sp.]|uniref:hypothetical protein n=1 Tax=Prosthecobacter sp. TaxID=1965333 RepID=UPI00378327EA
MITSPSRSETREMHDTTARSSPGTRSATRRSFITSLAGSLLCQCASRKPDVYLPVTPTKGLQKLLRRSALSITRPSGSGAAWVLSDSEAQVDFQMDFSQVGTPQDAMACLMATPLAMLGVMAYNRTYKQPSEAERDQARALSQDHQNAADWIKHYQSGFKTAAVQHGASSVRIVPPRPPHQPAASLSDVDTFPDLAGTGVDAVIDLHLSCRFEGTRTLRPALHTYCNVRRPGNRNTLWETAFDTKAQEAHTLREWIKNDGARFRTTIQKLPQQAAQQLVSALYAQ